MIREEADSPQVVVRRWYEAEGAKDFPLIPQDWPESCWFRLATDYPDMATWIAHQPYAPEAVIRHLAKVEDWRVRRRVAVKRNLPKDLFSDLAEDSEPVVRMAIAGNARAPHDVVARLALDPQEDVARTAALSLERRQQSLSKETRRQRS